MKKFTCTVTKETVMEIQIDENVWTPEAIEEWSNTFCDADNLSEIAENLAIRKEQFEDGEFIEGFGVPLIKGKKPYSYIKDEDVNQSVDIRMQVTSFDVTVDENK